MQSSDRLITDAVRIQYWMHGLSKLPIMQDFYGVAREVDGEIVAAFGYDHFQNQTCALHACVSTPTALSRALLTMAFRVPFNQWKYSCLVSMINADNAKSLTFARKLGFEEVAAIPGVMHFGVMYRDKCRWLTR